MIYLLCDAQAWTASFGKINLKNLQKLQKLDISGDDFALISGVKKPYDSIATQIHDQITHKKIPFSIKKYIDPSGVVSYKEQYDYLPLANPNNQSKYLNRKNRVNYNNQLEEIAATLEGRYRGTSKTDRIGQGLRKKKLTAIEKLATANQGSQTVKDLYLTQKNPTQEDVVNLIQEAKRNQTEKIIQTKKIRGAKPAPTTIEDKKLKLQDRQLERKYGA